MSESTFRNAIIALVVAVVCVAVGGFFWLSKKSYTVKPAATAPAVVVAAPPAATTSATSETTAYQQYATLRNGSSDVDVAVDERALYDLAKAASARSAKKYYAVFDGGRAFHVGDGTRVKIVGAGAYSGKVEILDGASKGRTGYVPQEWIASE